MAHHFTPAERAKAVATRKTNAEQKKLKAQQAVVATATTEITSAQADTAPIQIRTEKGKVAIVHTAFLSGPFDWWNEPLDVAVARMNDMKREYDRIAQIILSRQSRAPRSLHCWTAEHAKTAPRNVLAQCRKQIPDGRWVFCNNGHRDDLQDPQEKARSIYCCSQLCFMWYQQTRPSSGLSRH